MIIRLGYACLSKTLDNVTSSSSLSYTNYLKNENPSIKLNNVIISNLEDLDKIITYNIKNNIHVFRLSSAIIPLATMESVKFDYIKPYLEYYKRIGNKIKKANMRASFHPDQYTVLNSTRKEVIDNSKNILEYHYNLLAAFDIKDKLILLHIGSSTFGKEHSINRFKKQFKLLDKKIQKCIAIENDDKIFNAYDTLNLAKELNIPMVLDYHHHICNGDFDINEIITDIFNTWNNINPKVHFSSPKSKFKKDFRSHNEYIDSETFIQFIEKIRHLPFDIDIMIEAKAKDEALFKLIRELKYKTNYKFIDDTSFEV